MTEMNISPTGDPTGDLAAMVVPADAEHGSKVLTPDADGNITATLVVTVSQTTWFRLYGDDDKGPDAPVTAEQVADALTMALGSWLDGHAEVAE